jgi:hypothetical protein
MELTLINLTLTIIQVTASIIFGLIGVFIAVLTLF